MPHDLTTNEGRDAAADELRVLLERARRDGYASVVEDVLPLLPQHYGTGVLRRVKEREDVEMFGFVLREILARHPTHWLRGYGDEGAAQDLLADEEYEERRRRGAAK